MTSGAIFIHKRPDSLFKLPVQCGRDRSRWNRGEGENDGKGSKLYHKLTIMIQNYLNVCVVEPLR